MARVKQTCRRTAPKPIRQPKPKQYQTQKTTVRKRSKLKRCETTLVGDTTEPLIDINVDINQNKPNKDNASNSTNQLQEFVPPLPPNTVPK